MEAYRRTFFTTRGIAVRQAAGARRAPTATAPGRSVEDGYDELDLFAGAMHYWRVDHERWRSCLLAMKSLGLRMVETYVPWGVHEVGAGSYDFTGDRDLGAFLDLAAELGMYAIVRPGPHINAELTCFGFPRRILEQRELLAVSGQDTPVWFPAPPRMFPVPSYAARGFQEQVAGWFAAVGEIVAPRLAPEGPVIAVQVDNEALMFFRFGAYDHDYHPDALAWWHQSAGAAPPPRRWDPADAARCVRWVAFKDEYTARSLAWMTAALSDAGLGEIARFHNLPPVDPAWVDIPRLEAAMPGTVGMDFYHRARDYADCRRRALYLVGSATPLPCAPEVGMGGPLWLEPMSAQDQQFILLGLLAAGVRGLNLYMAVDRDRWYGAPISTSGALREPAPWLRRLLAVLAEIRWTSLYRVAPLALVLTRADMRFGLASSVVDPLTPLLGELVGLGPAGAAELGLDEHAAQYRRWLAAVEQGLALAQVPYAIVDEGCPVQVLARYRAVLMPTVHRVDRAAWRRLKEVAQAGTVVVVGPHRPAADELDQPLGTDAALPPRSGLIQSASLDDLEGLADDLAALVPELPDAWMAEQAAVDCSLFVDAQERPKVLFVGNPTGSDVVADVVVPGGLVLEDAMSKSQHVPRSSGIADIPLVPYEVRMLLVREQVS